MRLPFVIDPLCNAHQLDRFDCGIDSLSVWLRRFAWVNVQNDSARVYAAHRGDSLVVGYHALVAGEVKREESPPRVGRGLAAHPVGVAVLARLAVNVAEQGQGLGRALLQDALLRFAQAADVIGVRAVMVHAIDKSARAFYLRFGFEPSPVDEMRLLLLMKDLRTFLSRVVP